MTKRKAPGKFRKADAATACPARSIKAKEERPDRAAAASAAVISSGVRRIWSDEVSMRVLKGKVRRKQAHLEDRK